MKKLEAQALENITGGVMYDGSGRPLTDDVCPSCGWEGLLEMIDMDSTDHMKVLYCSNCYNEYCRNAAGELVFHRRFLG